MTACSTVCASIILTVCAIPSSTSTRLRQHAPDGWILGEKILEPGEFLREGWPIDGTSGYDFMNTALGVLADADGLRALGVVYNSFTRNTSTFPVIAHESKMMVLEQTLGSDVNRLTSLFVEICEENRNQRDFTRTEIRRALRETAACFAIYRTYVVPERARSPTRTGTTSSARPGARMTTGPTSTRRSSTSSAPCSRAR